jgi:hypothetical protein|tara:strand:+ start:2264 stop:2890 length:627 start_codon:yes stop_codon:yes gene_type:complete
MAITTYTELKTSVENWLNRDDLTDRIPEFIALAEAQFNRELRIRGMEGRYTASTVSGQKNYMLPGGYIQMRNFQINTDPITALEYVTPEIHDRLWGGSKTGVPQMYTMVANELILGPTPDSIMTMEMDFYKAFDALSSTVATNWVLANAPDLYLYGALLNAEPFLVNDERLGTWKEFVVTAITAIQSADARDRHSGSSMRVMNTTGYY